MQIVLAVSRVANPLAKLLVARFQIWRSKSCFQIEKILFYSLQIKLKPENYSDVIFVIKEIGSFFVTLPSRNELGITYSIKTLGFYQGWGSCRWPIRRVCPLNTRYVTETKYWYRSKELLKETSPTFSSRFGQSPGCETRHVSHGRNGNSRTISKIITSDRGSCVRGKWEMSHIRWIGEKELFDESVDFFSFLFVLLL